MFDTITAISTGYVNQPISIIRISGDEAFSIAKKVFKGKVGKDKTITYGHIFDENNEIVDEVLVSWFKGPNTFTGENIIEINAHGGVVNTNKILQLILSNGARLAEKGEFSQRAFLNGKMDLIKAEAIHDLIFANSDSQAKISVRKFDGKTSSLIDHLKDKIMKIIATIETNIDYPEYDDIEDLTHNELLPKLNDVLKDIDEILQASQSSKYIYEGVKTAIVGKPNSGKSTLLNALAGEDKAIVTNVPGTTRDVVEASVQIGQVLFKFLDTAGIHSTSDQVEQMGIKKSLEKIEEADLVIHLIDPTYSEDYDDEKIMQASKGKPYIKAYNKSDLSKSVQEGSISISAKNNDVDQLLDSIKNIFKDIDLNNDKILYNTRQLSLISSSKKSIQEALSSLKDGREPSEVIIDIRNSWMDLANILGRAEQEDILDTMFRNFCLGK